MKCLVAIPMLQIGRLRPQNLAGSAWAILLVAEATSRNYAPSQSTLLLSFVSSCQTQKSQAQPHGATGRTTETAAHFSAHSAHSGLFLRFLLRRKRRMFLFCFRISCLCYLLFFLELANDAILKILDEVKPLCTEK